MHGGIIFYMGEVTNLFIPMGGPTPSLPFPPTFFGDPLQPGVWVIHEGTAAFGSFTTTTIMVGSALSTTTTIVGSALSTTTTTVVGSTLSTTTTTVVGSALSTTTANTPTGGRLGIAYSHAPYTPSNRATGAVDFTLPPIGIPCPERLKKGKKWDMENLHILLTD
jgi:hypothetical protein